MEDFKLRDYQIEALNVIDRDLQTMPDVLLQAITGAGKTTIFSRLVNKYYKETERRFLILVHKGEIVQQIYNTLRERTDIPFRDLGICCASLNNKTIDRRVTVASVQTFINLKDSYGYADLIIIDEIHRANFGQESQYQSVINYLRLQRPNCRLFGCTSTPARLGHGYIYGNRCKKGATNLFPKLNHVITYEELRKKGYLVRLEGMIASPEGMDTDLAGISTSGDYNINELGELLTQERHLHTAVEAIGKFCGNYKKLCVFCCTIEHAEQLCELIGESATVVHSQLNPIERAANMEAWISGKKRIVCSVNILTEGVDVPALDCLVMARPTLSSTLYLQAIGRVLRLFPGKDHGFLVDLTHNSSMFGTDLDNVKITIPKAVQDIVDKERSMWKICPNCDIEVHVALRECSECGFQWPEAECVIAQALPEMKPVEFKRLSPVWFDVDDVAVEIHESKKNGKLLGKVTFRYWESQYKSANVYLWLCFADYYSGFAVQAAQEKWEMISEDDFPATVDEFMNIEFETPSKILLDCNGKYPEILDFQYRYESFETFCENQETVNHIDYDDEVPF